eukprot:Amastigsp_a512069_33.p3 type:complete len:108 gc:universal Amastigsp_a512069_33:809-486(-)
MLKIMPRRASANIFRMNALCTVFQCASPPIVMHPEQSSQSPGVRYVVLRKSESWKLGARAPAGTTYDGARSEPRRARILASRAGSTSERLNFVMQVSIIARVVSIPM